MTVKAIILINNPGSNSNKNNYLTGVFTASVFGALGTMAKLVAPLCVVIQNANHVPRLNRTVGCISLVIPGSLSFAIAGKCLDKTVYGDGGINFSAMITGVFIGNAFTSALMYPRGKYNCSFGVGVAGGALVGGVVAESVKNYFEK